ncbi:GUstatory Receptor family [Ditylenchus destructor]|nr:GUstatory Receptor family [Ditylenchus destructor]
MTGLYLCDHIRKDGNVQHRPTICCTLRYIRVAFLFLATILYALRSLYRIFTQYHHFTLHDVGYMVWFGWQFQAIISIAFVIYWQLTGSIQHIIDHILFPICNKNIVTNWMQKKRRTTKTKWLMVSWAIIVWMLLQNIANIIMRPMKKNVSFFEPTMGLHSFDFIYRFIGVYDMAVHNIVLCFFVLIVTCITIELEQFNMTLREIILLHSSNGSPHTSNISDRFLAKRLLKAFTAHKDLGRKIHAVDKIFQHYVLVMVATGTPISIFALVSLIRIPKSWTLFIFYVKDILCCLVHLVGFAFIPAQLYAQYNAVQTYIVCSSSHLTKNDDKKVYHIALSFVQECSEVKVGLSLGGLIVVTKPFLFQCVSILLPYLVLSLQANLGTDGKEGNRNWH